MTKAEMISALEQHECSSYIESAHAEALQTFDEIAMLARDVKDGLARRALGEHADPCQCSLHRLLALIAQVDV